MNSISSLFQGSLITVSRANLINIIRDGLERIVNNMAKKTAHIVSHSHWDREWYLPFETHRFYLVKLMDDLLEKLENDPEYRSFHLD